MTYNTLQQQSLHYFSRAHNEIPAVALQSSAAWKRSDVADPAQWRYSLSSEEIDELYAAVKHALSSGKELRQMTRADFPLPGLKNAIANWTAAITSGLGFQVIRGIPVARWSESELECFFWCFGQHIGVPGAQNRDNDLLGHVRDDGSNKNDPTVRQYRTTTHIPYHCDAADVVGLLCVKKAKQGGISRIVSSVTVFNELLARKPDLVPELFKPFHLDTHQEGNVYSIPIIPCRCFNEQLRTFYHSDYFRSVQRYPHARLTDQQSELLDLYDEITLSKDFFLEMDFEPGDIQLVSNHALLHSRTDYEDSEDPEEKRHLLRLWISVDQAQSGAEKRSKLRNRLSLIGAMIREKLRYRISKH
jgi:hypothetical protein